ncbi:MAG: hypothetical protein GX358_02695 [candidate division WS1 bacterium]|jgi:prepilin peptidase CpaA|nr:hypothetical protein [candidate division WS1 bacterium]
MHWFLFAVSNSRWYNCGAMDNEVGIIEWIAVGATVLVMAIAVYTDLRWSKIFNLFTAPFAVLGLLLFGLREGWHGLLLSLAGIVMGVGVWFILNVVGRILGAGDSKLLAAMGALLGPHFLLHAFIGTALVGGVLAILVALSRGYLLRSVVTLVRSLYMRAAHRVTIDIADSSPRARLPYAIPIFLGGMAALYYHYIYVMA